MKLIKKLSCCFFAFSLILFTISSIYAPMSAYFNRTVCQFFRELLALLTTVVPFSIFEGAVLLSPFFIIIVFIVVFKSKKSISKQFFAFISLFLIIPSLYFLTIGISYKTPSLFATPNNLNKDEFAYSTEILAKNISDIPCDEDSLPDMTELCDELTRSYRFFCDVHRYYGKTFPRPKSILFSEALSRMGTLAFYSFPTGEININTEIPDYTVPFTVAHEYAHYVGISSERDANFMAFLACINCDNRYVRYSGMLSGLEYLICDIYKSDRETYEYILSLLPERAISDMELYREYSKKYENGFVYNASDKLNSTHLDIWDENGRYSYSGVSKLIVGYINRSYFLRIKCSETTVFWSEKWDDLLYAGVKL